MTALHDFSLAVESGEFITILGSSGSGKTTALNALAGFMPVSSGDIRIGGRSVTNLPPERRELGMVFQNYSLFPHMSVAENVAFPLKMRGTARKDIDGRVKRALHAVQLEAYRARMPRELSGGQQQRVAIARAIVFEPPVLLMDEPLGALDLKLREALQFEIKSIQHQLGCTVVYVTHDQREALAMSDRIVVLRDGHIAQVGTPLDMYDQPRSRFVAQFIGQTNLFPADLGSAGQISIPGLGISWTDARPATRSVPYFISVRPEHLTRRPGRDGDVRIDATLDEAIFLGDVIDFSARHSSGTAIHFREPRIASAPRLQRGDTVSLAFSPGDAALVPDL
ncbi:ABC transporter ATP-binding protein [Paraburkholderia sp. BL6665CI2N2]|uniref:ABC transporter ATP-binding protein n=1 Tax=Paraburkholderia sp. BL6665CI2N2 TaxID=1938806 RepID=UPI001AB04EA4|nr:ABC transporter ATP-binding protein [Paraburkholderia sp. BL6665CI2N2]